MIESMAQLYAAGLKLDFAALDTGHTRKKLSLPSYPFQRQRYWADAPKQRSLPGEQVHPLLGVRRESASGEVTFTQTVCAELEPWLSDHHVFDALVAPGAMYACLALASGSLPLGISDGQIHAPFVLADEQAERTVQAVLRPVEDGNGVWSFGFFSQGDEEHGWKQHAVGEVGAVDASAMLPEALETIRARLSERDVEGFYERLAELGVVLGPSFMGLVQVLGGDAEALGVIETPAELNNPEGLEPPRAETITLDLWLLDGVGTRVWAGAWIGVEASHTAGVSGWAGFYEVQWRERPLTERIVSAEFLLGPTAVAESNSQRRALEFAERSPRAFEPGVRAAGVSDPGLAASCRVSGRG